MSKRERQLKALGVKVYCRHVRPFVTSHSAAFGVEYEYGTRYDFPYQRPEQCGGTTTVVISRAKPDGTKEEFTGYAHCNPSDVFNRRLGREIALGRALKASADA